MKSVLMALAALASIAAAPQGDGRVADFRVGGVSFAVPMPEGYCLPVERQADVAQLLASMDTENVTDVTLMRCNVALNKGTNDYTIIKTPRRALMVTMSRPQLLISIGQAFDNPVAVAGATDQKSLDAAAKNFSDTFGTKVSLSGDFVPRGKDEVCGYMAGVLRFESPRLSYDQPVAACLTAVGGRMLMIYRAGLKGDDASMLQLMRETRAIALTIKPISGT